jgi:hypothetical protein
MPPDTTPIPEYLHISGGSDSIRFVENENVKVLVTLDANGAWSFPNKLNDTELRLLIDKLSKFLIEKEIKNK